MADTPLVLSGNTGWSESAAGLSGSSLLTGDLRRRYNFGDRVSELSIPQDPFFRFVSKVAKAPTDDPEFKFSEKRPFFNKRYGYVVAHNGSDMTGSPGTANNYGEGDSDATLSAQSGDYWVAIATDFLSAGNISNVIGQYDKSVGSAGTQPQYYLEKQVIRMNTSGTAGGGTVVADFILGQIQEVVLGFVCHTAVSGGSGEEDFVTSLSGSDASAASSFYEVAMLKLYITRGAAASSDELAGYSSNNPVVALSAVGESASGAGDTGAADLEPMRVQIVGTSYEEGSSLLGKTWSDQPWSTGSGLVQTFRDEFGMTNKARATVLKYEPNEFARIWKDHMVAHKFDIEQAGLFSSQGKATIGSNEYWYTQGAVDYIINYGNIFPLVNTGLLADQKTSDDFLDDMSKFLDPRYNAANATLFFCDTTSYNWLHKLGGFYGSTLNINSNQFRADFSITGKKKVFGVDMTTISTPYGDMNVVRNIHLDGSAVKILGINMKYVKYRPLVGNGINRDTSVYVGVQTLENSGVDKRVDMILTEAGFEWSMPEAHVLWK